MNFKKYLELFDAQKKIDKLSKRYRNKKVAIYGAGQFFNEIFQNYDLSKLNIVAVADKKFEDESKKGFFGLNCIKPSELGNIDCDAILISNFNYLFFNKLLNEEILFMSKNADIEIKPLIKLEIGDFL